MPDYKINLVAPASIKDSDFGKFRTSLKEVLSFIKYSQDADRLGEVVEADEGFRHLGRTEVDVLNACVGANLEMEKGREVIDVCLALEEMKRRAAEKERRTLVFGCILPTAGRIRDFHPLERALAGRTKKASQISFHSI